jgi:hypothetical protein
MKRKTYRNILYKNLLLVILLGFTLFASGCAAQADKMIPDSFNVTNKHPFMVRAEGSVEDKRTSQIPDAAFTEALTESILKSGLFKGVVSGEGADYLLEVTILRYDQPWIGLDFNVNMETSWKLFKSGRAEPVWSDTITTAYKTTLWDAFFAVERLQRANEGAVRANIQEGIKRLSMLRL